MYKKKEVPTQSIGTRKKEVPTQSIGTRKMFCSPELLFTHNLYRLTTVQNLCAY